MTLSITAGAVPMIERCPLEIKVALGVWPPPGKEHEVAKRVKHVFDPHEVLSPGRFRGGI
jgi:hypothetical protein